MVSLFMTNKSWLVCMIGVTFVYVDMMFYALWIRRFVWCLLHPLLLLSWMFEHACLMHGLVGAFL